MASGGMLVLSARGGRRDVGFRGRGKSESALRDESDDDGDGCGSAKTPSSTNVGDGDAARLDSRFKSRTGLGAFVSVTGGELVNFEHDVAVLEEYGRGVLFESETADPELGSLTM